MVKTRPPHPPTLKNIQPHNLPAPTRPEIRKAIVKALEFGK